MSNLQFNLTGHPDGPIDTNLLYVSTSRYDSDWHSSPHTHYFAELFYITRGVGHFYVEGVSVPIKENDLIIVNANVDHTELSNPEAPLEYIVAGVEGVVFNFGEEQAPTYSIYNSRELRRELLFYFNTLVEELQNKKSNYESLCRHLFEVLFICIVRLTGSTITIAAPHRTSKECAAAQRYIDANYKQAVTLDTLAAATHMNKYYLVHAFQKYMGMSPISYLTSRRLEESKALLRDTDLSIAQIAGFIGFSSQSYFSQVFQKNTGESPGSYRKNAHDGAREKSS